MEEPSIKHQPNFYKIFLIILISSLTIVGLSFYFSIKDDIRIQEPLKTEIKIEDVNYNQSISTTGLIFTIKPCVKITDFEINVTIFDKNYSIIFDETQKMKSLTKDEEYNFTFSPSLEILLKMKDSQVKFRGYKSINS